MATPRNDSYSTTSGGAIYAGRSAPAGGDATLPTQAGSITASSITQTGFTISWPAGADNVGIAGYEYSTNGGSSWVNAGNVLTANITGLTAGTQYAVRVRAYDAAGNKSTPALSATVNTTAAVTDTTVPTLTGTLSASNINSTWFTLGWPAASDNVAVTGYEYSTNGGATWANAGNVLAKTVSGLTANTAYTAQLRAYDAAGNKSNPLSIGVTTAAADVTPTWAAAVAARTIISVPASNILSDVDPEKDATVNPNGTTNAPWSGSGGGFAATITAWNSMCWDEVDGRLWQVAAGGHADYAGNGAYCFNAYQDTPNWQRRRNPSHSLGSEVVYTQLSQYQPGYETGLYADGRPRSVHTYNNILYAPGYGVVLNHLLSAYPGSGYNKLAWRFDPGTNDYVFISDWTATGGQGIGHSGGAYDPTRNCIWIVGGENCSLLKLDMSTGVCTQCNVSDNRLNRYTSPIYIPGHDVFVGISDGNGGYWDDPHGLSVFNLTTFVQYNPTVTGAGSMGHGGVLTSQSGAEWCPELGCILLWNNSSNTNEITTLTPGANVYTDPWTLGVLTFTGVTPTVSAPNGTRGRFRYSSRLGGCLLINGVDQPVYFFKL